MCETRFGCDNMCESTNEQAFAGIDVGSLTTKAVIISNGGIAGSGMGL